MKRKTYIKFDDLGNITEVSSDSGEGWLEIPDGVVAHPDKAYVVAGKVVPFTPLEAAVKAARPSNLHSWDNLTMTWQDKRSLDAIKMEKWREIKATRDAMEFSDFTWDGSVFDSDEKSQSRIQGAAQLATLAMLNSQAFSVDWTLADNSVRTLSGSDVIKVGMAMGTHIMAVHVTGRYLREQLELATTSEQVEAVVWPAP